MARGRKAMYRKDMIEQAHAMGALGFSMPEMALVWNVSERTLYRWAEKHPEFRQAINQGRLDADQTVIQALFRAAKEGNVRAIERWLACRRPEWRPEIRVDHTHTGTVNVEHNGPLIELLDQKVENDGRTVGEIFRDYYRNNGAPKAAVPGADTGAGLGGPPVVDAN